MSYPELARDADDTSMYNNEPRDRNFDLIHPLPSFSSHNSSSFFGISPPPVDWRNSNANPVQCFLIRISTSKVADFAHDEVLLLQVPNATTLHANPVVLAATWFSSLGMIAKGLAWPTLVTRDATNAHARFKQVHGLRNFAADAGFKQASSLSLAKLTRHYSW